MEAPCGEEGYPKGSPHFCPQHPLPLSANPTTSSFPMQHRTPAGLGAHEEVAVLADRAMLALQLHSSVSSAGTWDPMALNQQRAMTSAQLLAAA